MRAPFRPRHLLLASLLLFVALPSTVLAAWPSDPSTNFSIAPSSSDQLLAQILPDGTGGAYFLFTDKRSGTEDVFLQRVTAAGALAGGWPSSGLQVAAFPSRQLEPQMVSDGAGGVIAVWADYRFGNGDIFAQRVNANGTLAGGSWPAIGLQLSSSVVTDRRPMLCSDGAGGALVAWEDTFNPNDTDVWGARVTSNGSIPFDQVLDFSSADARQISVAPDNTGGYFVVYQDSSSANSGRPQIFAVRADGSGTALAGPSKISFGLVGLRHVNPRIVSDGGSGFFAMWMVDDLHPNFDLEVERYASSLNLGADWPIGSGTANLTSQGLATPDFSLISDGAGAFIYSWRENNDVWVGHGLPNYYQAGGAWPVDLGTSGALGGITPDGSAGVIGAYFKSTSFPPALIAQRVAGNGATPLRWGTGVPVRTAESAVVNVNDASDGAHGAIVGWSAIPNGAGGGAPHQVCAERVDRFAALGNAGPAITGIADVVGDQGGHVRLAWNGSYLDSDPYYAISSYYIWRQTPASTAMAAVRLGARWADDGGAGAAGAVPMAGRLFRHSSSPAYAWEFIASQPTNGSSQYTYTAATTRDSTGTANPSTAFMVEARWSGGTAFWDSAPDSGYSVDNLAPSAPAQFTGQYASGSSALHWLRNVEPDLAGYRLYRGVTVTFTPGPSNRVASPPDTGWVDAAGAAYYYKLSAVDVHGNESLYATLLPQGVAGVPGGGAAPKLALAVVSQNPTSGEATLRFDLTRDGPVRLALYNASGRLVREIAGGGFAAGPWFRSWDGHDATGAVAPSGLYFVRLSAEGRMLTRKVVLLR
jgi:hypothetical protein